MATVLTAVALAAQPAVATTYTWTGVSSASWATGGNWSPSGVPGIGDIARFATAFSNQPTLAAAASVDGLWVTGATSATIGPASFTLTLMGTNTINGNANTGIEMDPGAALSITASIALNAPQTWLNNSASLLSVSGAISGVSGLTFSGSGNTILSGINTYTGATHVNGGTLTLQNGNSAQGDVSNSAITIAAAATLNLNFSDALGFANTNSLTVYGTVAKTFSQSGDFVPADNLVGRHADFHGSVPHHQRRLESVWRHDFHGQRNEQLH